jgi:hypothetical protein
MSEPVGPASGDPSSDDRRWARFMSAYNEIEEHLKRELGNPGKPLKALLNDAVEGNHVTAQQRQALHPLMTLRNAISHGSYHRHLRIAEPVEEAVAGLELLRESILRPALAREVLPARSVVGFQASDPLSTLLQAVAANNYSQFPIYRQREYVGLLTTNAVTRWLAVQITTGSQVTPDVPLEDMLHFIEMDERAAFLPSDTKASDVVARLSPSDDGSPPHLAVILTPGGLTHEVAEAMAVADDLHLLIPSITVRI